MLLQMTADGIFYTMNEHADFPLSEKLFFSPFRSRTLTREIFLTHFNRFHHTHLVAPTLISTHIQHPKIIIIKKVDSLANARVAIES
jgi:hypothetical protein